MKVTVCELPDNAAAFEQAWDRLCDHVEHQQSEFVVLPEMPFYRWLAHTREVSSAQWEAAVQAHDAWGEKFHELGGAAVVSTRPTLTHGLRYNVGVIWDVEHGITEGHTKYYLPDEPGFWEATWYDRGEHVFEGIQTAHGHIGFLICTELWFPQHARAYGQQGVQVLVCPRATPSPSAAKWVAGGQTAAVVSGAFCVSSNLSGKTTAGGNFAGVGWIIEPEEGTILGLTSADRPFVTVDIDLAVADKAKQTYPRYVRD